MGDMSDPLIYSVIKNSQDIELNKLEDFGPDYFCNLNFIFHNKISNTNSTFKIQLSTINIEGKDYYNFVLDDISLRRQVSQIQQEAIKFKLIIKKYP